MIVQADAIEWLNGLEPHSVDLIISSPPYENARLYLEDGQNIGVARYPHEWVEWMYQVYKASLRVCRGLVAYVVEGRTRNFEYSATPILLAAKLAMSGITLRKPPIFHRVGIAGSGGPDWLRNDYEFIICATNGGKLPWSCNTACGKPPKYAPGGEMSYRNAEGVRKNERHRKQSCHRDPNGNKRNDTYIEPKIANPGNVVQRLYTAREVADFISEFARDQSEIIHCKVGGGVMGSKLCHENEAPFPEKLAEFFIKSFCPPGGVVADPFAGSGTTLAVAERLGRVGVGCDIRASQVNLTQRRLQEVRQ